MQTNGVFALTWRESKNWPNDTGGSGKIGCCGGALGMAGTWAGINGLGNGGAPGGSLRFGSGMMLKNKSAVVFLLFTDPVSDHPSSSESMLPLRACIAWFVMLV